MSPFVHFLVDGERFCPPRVLGDDDLGAACVQFGDDDVAVERLVSAQHIEGQFFDQRRDADRVKALSGSSVKRTRLPSASVSARILVAIPPFERPMTWFFAPFWWR